MEIFEVNNKDFSEVIRMPYYVYGSAAFNDLNRNKCDEVFYLIFREGKYRLGIIGGSRDKIFYSPFSAPFGGYSYISEDIRLQYLEEAIRLLDQWANKKDLLSICMTLPPVIYSSSFIAKQVNCLWRQDYKVSEIDLNYSFEIENFNDRYPERIWYNARKNLKISMNAGLELIKCENDDKKRLAYEIISKNREGRGYPLKMSWEQVKSTAQLIESDFFLVWTKKQLPIASAIIFHISDTVVQVVYWGDLQGYSELKPMNFISYKIFEYYKSSGVKIVDIGPSTERSLPNYGLCEFKEGIGCRIDPKYTLIKKLS
jgi:hypothetical protein